MMGYSHGIDNAPKADYILKDKKSIGLLSNYTGVDSHFNRSVDVLNRRYKLTKLYAPGTAWENIPDDWTCPVCGLGKDAFEEVK